MGPEQRSTSACEIGSGEIDQLFGSPVKNGARKEKAEALRLGQSCFWRHGQLLMFADDVDERRPRMVKGGCQRCFQIFRLLDANSFNADGLRHGREIRIFDIAAGVEKAACLHLQFDEAERAIVQHDHLHRQAQLVQA